MCICDQSSKCINTKTHTHTHTHVGLIEAGKVIESELARRREGLKLDYRCSLFESFPKDAML